MYETLAVLAGLVFLYGGLSRPLERSPFGGAILFTLAGLALGVHGLGVLHMDIGAEGLSLLAELALAMVLFTDAANADLRELSRSASLPRRLLLVGLPLTILLGFACGYPLLGGLAVIEVAILAVVLAPTDAALGKAVVTNEAVPNRIRTGLNMESGLNDGICVPLFLAALAAALETVGEQGFAKLAFRLIVEQIGIGALVGLGVSLFGALLIKSFSLRGWITDSWRQLPVPALVLGTFAVAQSLGGSGFIACFCAGLLFGWIAKAQKHSYIVAAEGTGETLALLTWTAFGAVVVGRLVTDGIDWRIALYAVLSLTFVRMLPVWIALRRLAMPLDEVLFVGWFGPRGLASIVFAVMAIESGIPGGRTIAEAAACTILFSVLAHGVSAGPLAQALATRVAARAPATG